MIDYYILKRKEKHLVHFTATFNGKTYSAAEWADEKNTHEVLFKLAANYIKEEVAHFIHQRTKAYAFRNALTANLSASASKILHASKLKSPHQILMWLAGCQRELTEFIPSTQSKHKYWIEKITAIKQYLHDYRDYYQKHQRQAA